MDDLISRQEAIDAIMSGMVDINDSHFENASECNGFLLWAKDEVMKLPSAQPKQRWIPVTERLPEKSGEYLVTYHPCYWDDVESEILVGIDTFRGKTTWAQRKYQRVVAWMPLPEPYRKETTDV